MKNKRCFFIISIISAVCFVAGITISNAKVAPLSQEEIGQSLTNPNPPSTDFEKRVIKFSEIAVRQLLGISSGHPLQESDPSKGFQRPNVRIAITEKDLLNVECDASKQQKKHV